MNRNDDFDQTLEAWLRREAPPQAPDRVLDSALQRVAAQSQKRGWLQRLIGETQMTTLTRAAAVTAVVAVAAFIGLQLGDMPGSFGGSPSPTASVPVDPTASATQNPSTSSPAPSGDPSVATLVLRLDSSIDFSGLSHIVTVEADGRIITTQDKDAPNPFVERRLTAAGIELLRAELEETGLTDASGEYEPIARPGVEPPGRGAVVHTLRVGLAAGGTAVIRWVAMYDDEDLYYEPSPEREMLDALALRLQTLDEWLPANAWADPTAAPYLPARLHLLIQMIEWGGAPSELPVEFSEVAWPLETSIDESGEVMESPHLGLDSARCGLITADEATALVDALAEAGATRSELLWSPFELGERESNLLVRITISPAMPDQTSCEGA